MRKTPRRPPPQNPHDESLTVCGIHAATAIIKSQRAKRLFVESGNRNTRIQQLCEQAEFEGIPIIATTRQQLYSLVGDDNHQGIVGIATPPTITLETVLAERSRPLVLLDGVTDPRNLGAILRIARAFDAAAVITPKRRTAPLSVAAGKTSAGAAADLPILRVVNIARTLKEIQDADWTVIGAVEDGDTALFAHPISSPVCFVLGDEGDGLRHLSRRYCDLLVRIPTVAGDAGCLNVAAACAVCLAATTIQKADSSAPNTP